MAPFMVSGNYKYVYKYECLYKVDFKFKLTEESRDV